VSIAFALHLGRDIVWMSIRQPLDMTNLGIGRINLVLSLSKKYELR
jgi:hypothetical protein